MKLPARGLKVEALAGGVEQPGVVVGALEARVQAEGLSRQLSGGQRAGVGQRAVGLALDVALLLPLGVIAESRHVDGVLHPLDHLKQTNHVTLDTTVLETHISSLNLDMKQAFRQ